MITTGDDFRSNYIDGYADAFTGEDYSERFGRMAGYSEGFHAFDPDVDLDKDEIEDLAYEAWDEYTGF